MTTIIGIRANEGDDAIVLAADYQLGIYNGDELVSKRRIPKLQTGEFWAIGDAGEDDGDMIKFYGMLRGNRRYRSSKEHASKVIERAVNERSFNEVLEINKSVRARKSLESTHSFILAVNKPSLELFLVDEFGNLQTIPEEREIDYLVIGSGSDLVHKYVDDSLSNEKLDRCKISVESAIKLATDLMRVAERDGASGLGYDLVILQENSIDRWGAEIKKALSVAEKEVVRKIVDHYTTPETDLFDKK